MEARKWIELGRKARAKRPEGLIGRHQLSLGDGGVALAHRAAVTVALWRDLGKELDVHHVDGDPTNNDLANLQVLTRAEHARKHKCGELYIALCPVCWRLFYWGKNRQERVTCSLSCFGVLNNGLAATAGAPEQTAAAKEWWVLKSYYAYLSGAPVPPPFRERLEPQRS